MTQLNQQVLPPSKSESSAKRRPASRGKRNFGSAISIGVIITLLIAWWVLTTATGTIPPLYFPSPESLWQALTTLEMQLLRDAGATLMRVVVSWLAGSALGVLVGLAMARISWLMYALNPLIEAVRPVPPVALIPFVILWFGIGDSGKIFLGTLACFMVMVVNTTVAVTNVPPVYTQAARSLGANQSRVYRSVIFPAIVPEILSG